LIAQVKRRPSGRPGDNVWPAQIGTCPQDLPCEINDAATAKGLSFTMVLVDLKNPWVMPARGLPRSLLPGAAALAASRRRRAITRSSSPASWSCARRNVRPGPRSRAAVLAARTEAQAQMIAAAHG
jgi:hypothetical protein